MATKREIMRQLLKGVSWNEVARSLGCSKATVAKCAAKMREEGLDAEKLGAMTDGEVSALLAEGRGKRGKEYLGPDWACICDQLARIPKMTLALQWARYCDCNPGGKRLYGYSGFCRKVGEYARTHNLAAHIAHDPGGTLLVDWAGTAAAVFDPVTGRRSPAYLFVACFPWSGWIYAECFADMRTRSWISAHAHALQAAGGVPDILVPDNCATATDHRRKAEPMKVNSAYLEIAEHYGCAVVPARVRRPLDKAAAEKAVDICEARVLAPLAEERFMSLEELNSEVGGLVDALNARPFSRHEGSRATRSSGRSAHLCTRSPRLLSSGTTGGAARRPRTTMCSATTCVTRRPTAWWGGRSMCAWGATRVAILDSGEVVAERPRLRGRKGQFLATVMARRR